jgi:hypothetical protein
MPTKNPAARKECQHPAPTALGPKAHTGDRSATLRVPNYWSGPARDQLGPDLLLCDACGAFWNATHPTWEAVRI